MKHQKPQHGRGVLAGPSQRQLRAGELVRHALAEILRLEEIQDPALTGVSVTVTEVRMGPDMRHATCFVEPLGGANADAVVKALQRASKFIRGRLARSVELKFVPDLHFRHDESFDSAAHMNQLFAKLEGARDLKPLPLEGGGVRGGGEYLKGDGETSGGAARIFARKDSECTPNSDPSPFEGEGRKS